MVGLFLTTVIPEVIGFLGGGLGDTLWLTPLVVALIGFLLSKYWVFESKIRVSL